MTWFRPPSRARRKGQTISASADMGGIVVRDLWSTRALANTQPLLAAALRCDDVLVVGKACAGLAVNLYRAQLGNLRFQCRSGA